MTFFNNAQATSTSCEKNKHGESLDGSRPKFNFKKKPKDSLASTHKKSMEGMVLIPPELKIDLSTKEQRSSSQSSKKEAKSIPHHFR